MPIITITGGIGCDVEPIAELVARQLDLPLFDDKKLLEEAERIGYSEQVGTEFLKERYPIFRLVSNKPEMHLDMMEAVIFEAVRKGNGVIPGHAGHMILHDLDGVLRVRLFASEKSRIQNISEKQGLEFDSARKIVHKSDSEKRGFLHFAFHKDWDDLSLYDIVINREALSNKEAVKLIADAAKTEKMKSGMDNMEEYFEKKALEKIVESALLKTTYANQLVVEVIDKDVVKLMGFVECEEYRDGIIGLVEKQPRVSRVISEIAIYPVGVGY